MAMKKTIILLCLLFSGCQALTSPFFSTATDAYGIWKDGEASKYYNYSSDSMYKAVKDTLKKLKFKITKEENKGNGNYYIVAGNGDQFKIDVLNKNNNISYVKIRVNFWGDTKYGDMIFDSLEQEIFTINF